jgi:hypothetical protein
MRAPILRKHTLLALASVVWSIGNGSNAQESRAIEDLRGSYEYLVSYRDTHGGALYVAAEGPFKGRILPFSFSDSAQYWGAYVCKQPAVSCAVTDYYDPSDYAVKVRPGPGAPLQTERVNVHNGTNIYDAATWQIAVVLGAIRNHFGNFLDVDPYTLATNQNIVLGQIQNTRNVPTGSRATTAGSLYLYNGSRISDPRTAYAFRMTAPVWLAPDPLKDSQYSSLISVGKLPGDNPRYEPGRVAWSDWKPITGDNAWAFLVGPLQAAYLHFVVGGHGRYVPFADPALQNAVAVLPAFAAMQSSLGAVYYAPAGTLQNEADTSVNPYFVSVENNLSLFAGLRILRATMVGELSSERGLPSNVRQQITRNIALIDAMLLGGILPDKRHTNGLLQFLHSFAWRDGEFVQGGLADDPKSTLAWVPVLEPRAVDVNTWGVASLGAKQVDDWFGFGAAYEVWRRLKTWGGYGEGRTLWGVGYSDADGNGQAPGGAYKAGVMSAEWTAGTIVMVRNLINYYHSVPMDLPNSAQARAFEAQLREDEDSLLLGIQKLRFGRYVRESLVGKPPDYANLIMEPTTPVRSEPYLYSSKRYRIPFGWYGNPIPSTASTAWVILVADDYDPFGYGGRPN